MFGIKTKFKRYIRTKRALGRHCRILADSYAQRKSLWTEQCLDGQGNHVPWFTYPAIEYLNQLDLSGKRVLEFGSGFSTLYWAKRCGHVVSIESSKSWFEKMGPKLPKNVEYVLAETMEEMVKAA